MAPASSNSSTSTQLQKRYDVAVVGAGHNALVCAILLARRGLSVVVVEEKSMVGGAAKTEYPFAKAPKLATSTGAYLAGVMPPELIALLGLDVQLCRRDPHYFLPTTGKGYLLFGSDQKEMRRQFVEFFSEADWDAHTLLNDEIAQIRDDLAPAWMQAPLSLHETAERYLRPALQKAFVDLVEQPISHYLARFPFESDLIRAMYATTDGFSGLHGGWDTPGTGHNFLVHNMCRLPGSDGTFMLVKGGMGMITQRLAGLARQAGAHIELDAAVASIDVEGGVAKSITLARGDVIHATTIVSGADPFRTKALVGDGKLPREYVDKIESLRKDGTTMKINIAFDKLPTFTCLPQDKGQYGPTIHILPQGNDIIGTLRKAYADVCAGKLADEPTIEWYFHTPIDTSMKDPEGRHNGALFVQWVPHTLADGKTWGDEEARYVKHLLSICDRFAPDTSKCVADVHVLTPPKIEQHFGITRGHIHHVDNGFAFDQRAPYELPVQGLFQCSAGTYPAGSVIGAPGHNAANVVLAKLGKV
jgi:phytoene dehydrogenase-like protein